MLPDLFRAGDTHMLIVYELQGRIETLHSFPVHCQTMVLSNFKIDRRSQGSASLLPPLLEEFVLSNN